MRRTLRVAAFVCATCHPALAAAQASDMSGAIVGRVTDQQGGAMSGVVVTLSSEALMAPMPTETASDGLFRFLALPPALYAVTFTRAGFATLTHRDVPVRLGGTAELNVTLELARFAVATTVDGRPPLVDARSTRIGVNFDAQQLSSLPGARGFAALLTAVPGVQLSRFDVGGSASLPSPAPTAYGISGRARPMVEGINIALFQVFGLPLDYGSFREVTIATAWPTADGSAAGLSTQFIVKSGGNRYHSSVYGDYEHERVQALNIDRSQLERDVSARGPALTREANRLHRYRDVNADVAGYLKRNRAWWYGSYRTQEIAARLVTFPQPHRMHLSNVTLKGTVRLGSGGQLVAFGTMSRNHQPNRLAGFLVASPIHATPDSTTDHRGSGWIGKLEWRSFFRATLFVEARIGRFTAHRSDQPRSDAPRYEDTETLLVTGGSRDWREQYSRPQALITATYFTDGRFGSHEVKAGIDVQRDLASETWNAPYPGGIVYGRASGAARSVTFFSTPSHSEAGMWWSAGYVSDLWRVHDRLSITLGARFDRLKLFLPPQSHLTQTFPAVKNLIAWTAFVPRLGIAYRLDAVGRMLLKATYGTITTIPGTMLAFNANPNDNQWWTRHRWSDDDRDGQWSPGEERQVVAFRGGTSQDAIDADLKLQYMREATASIERELTGAVVIRGGVVWRGDHQQFTRYDLSRPLSAYTAAAIVPDPGPDGKTGNGDDGRDITVFSVPPDVPPGDAIVRNVPNAGASHLTWELTAMKRPGLGWSLLAGFAMTQTREHANAYSGQSVRQNTFVLTPNDSINTAAHGRHEFVVWSARVLATFDAPWAFRITPFVRHQSGHPFGRTISVTVNGAQTVALTERIGTRRMDHLTVTDLRVERVFRFERGPVVSAFLDIFNMFNVNAEQNVSWLSGENLTFLQPLSIIPPRIARVGVRINW